MNYEPACYKVYTGNSNLNPDIKQIVTITFNVNYYNKGKQNINYFENNNVRFQTKNIDKTSNSANFSINVVKIIANKLKFIFDKADPTLFDKQASYKFRADEYSFNVSFINNDISLTGTQAGQNKTVLSWHFSLTSGQAFSDLLNLYINLHYDIQSSACLAISNFALCNALTDLIKNKTPIMEEVKDVIRENKVLVENNIETISNMQSQFNQITKDSITALSLTSLHAELDRTSTKIKELIKDYKEGEKEDSVLENVFINKIIWSVGDFLKTVFGVTFTETYLNEVFKSSTYISIITKNTKIFANENNFNNTMLFHIKVKDSQTIFSDEIINICLNLLDIYFTYKIENKVQEKTLFSLFIMPMLLPILINVKDSDVHANGNLKHGQNIIKLKNLVLNLSVNEKTYELQLKKFYNQFSYLSAEDNKQEVVKSETKINDITHNKQIKIEEFKQHEEKIDIFLGMPTHEKKITETPNKREKIPKDTSATINNVLDTQESVFISSKDTTNNKKLDRNAKMEDDISSTTINLIKEEPIPSTNEYLLKLLNKYNVPTKIIKCVENNSNQYELNSEEANCAYELPIQPVVALLNVEMRAENNKEYLKMINAKVKELNDTSEKLLRDSLYTLFIF